MQTEIITHTSAPSPDGRLAKEMETYQVLEKLGIPYERLDHEPAMTIDACADIDRILNTPLCKNLFLRNSAKTSYYLLLLPGEKSFRTKDVSSQIGSTRLSFGDEDMMQGLLNLTPGSVTVMGLMYDKEQRVTLLVDRQLLSNEYLCFHPCINTSSVKAKTADIIEKFLPYTGHNPIYVDL